VWLSDDLLYENTVEKIVDKLCHWILKIRSVSANDKKEIIIQEDKNRLIAELFSDMPVDDDKEYIMVDKLVEWAVKKLFRDVRAHVIKMRLESFAKLHRYIQSDHNCRRIELLEGMTDQAYGVGDYVCDFCDSHSCIPTLKFRRDRARTADDSVQFRDLYARVQDSFINQNILELEEVIKEAENRYCLGALGHQATNHLESYPDNLAANYLAAESYRMNKDKALRNYAHRYYRQYARIANVEHKDRNKSQLGYSAYYKHDPAETIRTYAVPEAAFDNHEDLIKLADDAEHTDLEQGEVDNLNIALMASYTSSFAHKVKMASSVLDEFFS
jgi:hypothetical protein